MLINFKITNITCDACVKLSVQALKKIRGVKRVEIETNGVTALESDREIDQEEIKNTLAKINKTVSFI